MPELPTKKVGLIACCGEEMPEGTVTRLAVRKVLESLRPQRSRDDLPAPISRRGRGRARLRASPPYNHRGWLREAVRCSRHSNVQR